MNEEKSVIFSQKLTAYEYLQNMALLLFNHPHDQIIYLRTLLCKKVQSTLLFMY